MHLGALLTAASVDTLCTGGPRCNSGTSAGTCTVADFRRGLWRALDPGRRGDTRCCGHVRRVANANTPCVVITEAVRASRDGLGPPRKSLVIKASVDH